MSFHEIIRANEMSISFLLTKIAYTIAYKVKFMILQYNSNWGGLFILDIC